MKIATLNVCGLKKRSQYPDFVEYFDKYDLICFVETKLEDIDVISIPGFQCFSQPRKQKYIRKSGGIALFAKDEIFQHCKYLATDSDYVMWISIDKSRISIDENLIIGITYAPPSQSRFFNDDELQTLENEITSMCSSHKYIFITGDLNARTGILTDYVQLDEFLAEEFELDDETAHFFDKTTILERLKIPLSRTSNDIKTNNIGYWLVNICKNNNLFIVNGRVGKNRDIVSKTFRDQSVLDHTLCTADCFYFLQQFEIIELDEIFSDGHSLLSWSFDINPQSKPHGNSSANIYSVNCTWKNELREKFIENIKLSDVLAVNDSLDTINPSLQSINNITNSIGEIFSQAATLTLQKTKVGFKKRPFDKAWFGPACKVARKQYHRAKHVFQIKKNDQSKENLKTQCKTYKKTMNKYIGLHKKT